MNVDDGSLRRLLEGEKSKSNEVMVNLPKSNCPRCKGKGSIPLIEGNRSERRRALKAGLPIWSKFQPCPECNPD